jgi:hypothetical protein
MAAVVLQAESLVALGQDGIRLGNAGLVSNAAAKQHIEMRAIHGNGFGLV